jgi:hypothetical protein
VLVGVLVGVAVNVSVAVGVLVGVAVKVLVTVGELVGVDVNVLVGVAVLVAVGVAVGVFVTVGVAVWVGVFVGGGPTQLLFPETTSPLKKLPDTLNVEKPGPEIGPIVSQLGSAPSGGGGGFNSVGPPDPDGPP